MATSFIPFAHKNSSKSSEYIITFFSYPTGMESGSTTSSSSSCAYDNPKSEPEEMMSKRNSSAKNLIAVLALAHF